MEAGHHGNFHHAPKHAALESLLRPGAVPTPNHKMAVRSAQEEVREPRPVRSAKAVQVGSTSVYISHTALK